jgi:hypothetical protein
MAIENVDDLKSEPRKVPSIKKAVPETITPRNREERRLAKRQQRGKGR